MTDIRNVQPLMHRQFSAAKLGWAGVLTAQLLGLVISIVGFQADEGWTLAAAAAAILVPGVSGALKHWASGHYSRGEELRRLFVFVDGWGRRADGDTVLLALADGTTLPSWDPPPIGTYYDSSKPHGPERVVHILQQSAFHTTRHAATAAKLSALATVLALLVGAALLWLVGNGSFGSEYAPRAVQAASALLAFSISSEFLNLWLSFSRLSSVARDTVQKCESLTQAAELGTADIALLTGAYDAALGQAPPIPGLIYRLQRRRLDAAWKSYDSPGTVPRGRLRRRPSQKKGCPAPPALASLRPVSSPRSVDVKAILSAVYRPRDDEAERLAARVRSRLALIETASECVRLLVEAPSSALRETLGTSAVEPDGDDSSGAGEEKQGDN